MKHIEFTLAAALRQMLDDSGIHQADLAERADISKGSVTNYTKGRTVPRWSAVQRWAKECGYDPDDETLRALWMAARYGDDPQRTVIARYPVAA
jgi:transcriptional regulator with XRE-family HTH domain